jgi:hypothetical protein
MFKKFKFSLLIIAFAMFVGIFVSCAPQPSDAASIYGTWKSKGDGYTITEKGIRNADTVESSLPYSVRRKAAKLVAPVEEKMRRAAMITAKHSVSDDGCFVQLALSDGKGEIMNLRFLCADEEQAQSIEKNFRHDAENYYLKITELFSGK